MYKYDACNRLASVTQSNKRKVKIERDKLGRVIAQHASLATNTHIVNNANYYSYTLQGKIARAHNTQSTLKQVFDKGGRLLRAEQIHNQQQAHTLNYSYDKYGRRDTLTLPDSTTLKYSYNQFGQLSSINLQQANSSPIDLAQLTYDSQGNIKTQQFGNNITLAQQFNVFNRLTQQKLTHPAQALFDTCTYHYDSVNQLVARKDEGVSSHNINFEYNSLGQLIQQTLASSSTDTATQYQWDSFGNPQTQSIQLTNASEKPANHIVDVATNDTNAELNRESNLSSKSSESSKNNKASTFTAVNSFVHNEYSDAPTGSENTNNSVIQSSTEADRLTQFGDSDFDYDELGNQIRETGKGIKTLREYNAFNQLSCFNNNGTLTQYDYDPLGRRIAKHTEHGKIDYIWDNDQLIGECQHGEYTWYINLPNQFHPVALIKKGEVYYYHLDQLNTPRFVTNNKAEVVWENQADVYGYEEPETDADFNKENSFTQPIRFQGQYLDEESGLHYNRYRYYSPKQQRFINQDPIGLAGGINHYQYAPNPVNWVDPMGLLCENGKKTLKNMLGTLVGNGFDEETVEAIYKIAIACTPINNKDISTINYIIEGGVNRKPHEYSFEKLLPEENKIIITRELPSGTRISQTVSIKDFAQQHIDNNEKVANIHWGKILEKEHGVAKPSPEEMENAHAHHIVFKEGSGKQKEWVLKSKAILEKHKIDWLKGKENLVWAPNIEGLHTEEMAKLVYEALQEAEDADGTPEAVTEALRKMGRVAAEHMRGKKYT